MRVMKIGILTFFRPVNYGAYLQAYALSHRLNQEEDIEAEIIDFRMPAEDVFYEKDFKLQKNIFKRLFCKKRSETFRNELDKQLLSHCSFCSASIEDFIAFVDKKYDIIIAGSDELWKVDGYRGFPTPYFLPGNMHCIKVSFAVSGRTSFDVLHDAEKKLLQGYLNDFDYIGVRDKATADNVISLVDDSTKVHMNFDPSFVYDFKPDAENGRRILKQYFNCSGNKKVVAVMYNEGLRTSPKLCHYLKNEYGDEFDFISIYQWNPYLKMHPALTPFEWKDIVAAVDGVISMYFHGICFSILAGTPFLAIEKRTKSNEESKLYDLLNRIGQTDRYSLGLNSALKDNKVDHFMQEVSTGVRLDFTKAIGQARDEFKSFVEKLRDLYTDR